MGCDEEAFGNVCGRQTTDRTRLETHIGGVYHHDDFGGHAPDRPQLVFGRLAAVDDLSLIHISQRIAAETQAAENGGQAAAPQNHISTDLFEFDLPEYWSDRVSVTYNEDGGVSVYANNFPEASLVTLKITEASDSAAEDSADTAMVYSKDLGGGKHVELWMTNFAWIVFDVNRPEASPEGWQADLLDQSVASELVDLQTLGTVPVEKIIQPAKADGTQFETQIDWENAVNEIVPTIVVK